MEQQQIDISVIVPIYNVEEYLASCLNSLLWQGNVELEVIMIDDGSTDRSGEIARQYAQEYSNFRYHLIENGGLGHARNYGVQFARGTYIAFVDSDDIVVRSTYEKMFTLAQRDKSDLTICNSLRFKGNKFWSNWLSCPIFGNHVESVTHITRFPNLFYNAASWDKLILRDFFLKHQFQFPENILYEDIPVSIPMHYFANHVSLLNSAGYLWRVRDGATKSITQNNQNMRNLTDRLTILKMLDNFFAQNVSDQVLWEAKQRKALDNDLMIFINECESVSREQAGEILRLVNEYIDQAIDPEIFSSLSLINQQKYALVRKGDVDGLIRIRDYQQKKYGEAPVTEQNGRLIAELPDELFPIQDRDMTNEFAQMIPRKYIDAMTVKNDGTIEITAHVYKRRINIVHAGEQEITVWLLHELTHYRIPLEVQAVPSKQLTEDVGSVVDADTGRVTRYNYDGTGFRIVIDLSKLTLPREQVGRYKLMIHYQNRFTQGDVFLGGCNRDITNACEGVATVFGELMAEAHFSYLNELEISLSHQDVFLEDAIAANSEIVCRLSRAVKSLWIMKDEEHLFFRPVDQAGRYSLGLESFEPGVKYSVLMENEEEAQAKVPCRKRDIAILEDRSFAVVQSSIGSCTLSLQVYKHLTQIVKFKRNGAKLSLWLRDSGRIPQDTERAVSARLLVDDRISGQEVILAEAKTALKKGQLECFFQIDFGDSRVTKNFYQSIREVYIEYVSAGVVLAKESLYSSNFFSERFLFETLEVRTYRGAAGTFRLGLKQLWAKDEDTDQKRKLLTFQNYPKYREKPLDSRLIVFESMWGRKYSCNPRALYEYIDKHYPEYKCVWSLNDARTPIKGRGRRVRRGSQEYFRCLATAKYFVNNVNFQTEYVKRPEQVEIQTMHGTPLKTLGLDVSADFPTERVRAQFLEKCARWNYLIVQGRFMEEKAEGIYAFSEKILKTGYPRTDELFRRNEACVSSLKSSLGIPMEKRVILYAPTWRVSNRFDMQLDLERMRAALGEDYVLLVRIHHLAAAGYKPPEDRDFIFDLTSYRSIEDLYQVSDLLITDYSSVMFDFALLDKPMIFFAYDLEEYRDQLRGMYVDFEKEAPGPLVRTTGEVIAAILAAEKDGVSLSRAAAFKEKYLTYEREDSCRRIVKEVFHPTIFNRLRWRLMG